MYQSPISICETAMNTIIEQRENAIFAKVQDAFAVQVDKDELIRALQYDRDQYNKGYADGKADAVKWIPVTERLPEKDGQYLCNYHFGEHPTMTFTRVLDYYATDIVPHFQHTLGDGSMKVTHWMPLPEPPKGE